ncbi:MAG: hypothetical protein KAX49_14410 [Halanaerobiales bacterium]|nr:hypothetical protein [Halanaerobiales bacterium]
MNEYTKEIIRDVCIMFLIGVLVVCLIMFSVSKIISYKEVIKCNNLMEEGNDVKMVNYKLFNINVKDCYIKNLNGNYIPCHMYRGSAQVEG